MRNLLKLIVLFFTLTILSCKKEAPVQSKADELYTPYVTSIRNNGKVTLKWRKPICMHCEPKLDPLYFDILISDNNPSKLNVHSTVSSNVFEITIDNLTNGKPYYFAIRAVGQKQYSTSRMIMAIPAPPENIQRMFQTIDKSKELATWSPNQSSVGYVSNYYWNNGNNFGQSVLIYSFSNNTESLVEIRSRSPEWSPTGQKVVYQTDNGEKNTGQGFPTHISIYNTEDSTFKRLTSGNSFNHLPTWSPDGNWIAYLSNKSSGSEDNIWKIPSDSGTAVQITYDFNDLIDIGMVSQRSPKTLSWSKDGNNIAFARLTNAYHGFVHDIYTVSSNGGNKEILITSQWNDHAPAYSPDGTKIAFVSNRSGLNEIWTMDLQTKKLNQITGSKEMPIYTNPGKIEWASSGNKILFTSNSNSFWTLFTVDTN